MNPNAPEVEDEDADPVGPPAIDLVDPEVRFAAAAVEAGLIRPGDKLDANMVELCKACVEMAARIGDRYPIPDMEEDTLGDHIGAVLIQ